MKRFLGILIYLFLFVIVCYAKEEAVIWQPVADNTFLNTETIFGTTDVYGFSFMLKAYNKGQYEPVNGKSIHYTISQYTIDCGKNSYKIGVIDSYAEDGSFVNGDYNRYAKYRPIVVGTSVSKIAKSLCRPINNP